MSIVTITLNNRTFKLSCPEESHTELHSLAKELDNEINKIRLKLNPNPAGPARRGLRQDIASRPQSEPR